MASVLSSFVTVDWLTPLYASLCPGGAARVELCANLVDGGTTPSWGMLTVLRKRTPQQLDINVIIRPRGGDFAYSEAEFLIMFGLCAVPMMGMDDLAIFFRALPTD